MSVDKVYRPFNGGLITGLPRPIKPYDPVAERARYLRRKVDRPVQAQTKPPKLKPAPKPRSRLGAPNDMELLDTATMVRKGWSPTRRARYRARAMEQQMSDRVRYGVTELPPVTSVEGADRYSRLARAILAEVVADLCDPDDAEARAWLFDDTDLELANWRQTLCDLGDVSLEGIRRLALEGTAELLHCLAGKLRGPRVSSFDIR